MDIDIRAVINVCPAWTVIDDLVVVPTIAVTVSRPMAVRKIRAIAGAVIPIPRSVRSVTRSVGTVARTVGTIAWTIAWTIATRPIPCLTW